jgi:hypothetical protein
VVDLNQPRCPACIQHDVESKDLEYAASPCAEYGIGRNIALVGRHKLRVDCQDGLHTEIHHIRPDLIDIV